MATIVFASTNNARGIGGETAAIQTARRMALGGLHCAHTRQKNGNSFPGHRLLYIFYVMLKLVRKVKGGGSYEGVTVAIGYS